MSMRLLARMATVLACVACGSCVPLNSSARDVAHKRQAFAGHSEARTGANDVSDAAAVALNDQPLGLRCHALRPQGSTPITTDDPVRTPCWLTRGPILIPSLYRPAIPV